MEVQTGPSLSRADTSSPTKQNAYIHQNDAVEAHEIIATQIKTSTTIHGSVAHWLKDDFHYFRWSVYHTTRYTPQLDK
jgi:hypothetical protein